MNALMGLLVAGGVGDHMDDGWWVVMVGMLLFWGLIALAVVWGVRSFAGQRREDGGGATPMDVLDRRLADGSISIEEYEQRRRMLRGEREEGTG
jgi:putative membrane protein